MHALIHFDVLVDHLQQMYVHVHALTLRECTRKCQVCHITKLGYVMIFRLVAIADLIIFGTTYAMSHRCALIGASCKLTTYKQCGN